MKYASKLKQFKARFPNGFQRDLNPRHPHQTPRVNRWVNEVVNEHINCNYSSAAT